MADAGERQKPMVQSLILKRASTSRLSGEWNEDDYDVLTDGGVVVGRIFKVRAAPGRRGCGHSLSGITTAIRR